MSFSMSENLQEIQLSALNHYIYCTKRAYLCYVLNEFAENEYTLHGRSIHTRTDSGVISKRKDIHQIRSVWLRSKKYGLIGKSDLIEEKAGEIYPVEYKRGKARDWKNDQIQLTAQALCIEEMLSLKNKISKGYIFYHLSNCREEITIDENLRNATIKAISDVRNIIENIYIPDIKYNSKCDGCSMQGICLPKETEKINMISSESIYGG